MPQAVAFVISVVVGPFGLLGGTLLNAIGIPVSTGIVGKLLGLGPKGPKPSDGQQNVNEAIGSRWRRYGIVHSGGQRTFLESADGTIGLVVTLGTGEESDILEHRINDKVVTVVGGTVTESSYHGAVHIYTRSGTDDQTAIGEVTTKFPQWTANHRQRGCAHAAIIGDPVKAERFGEVYNSQVPVYTQVRKCVKLYDPRKDSTAVIGTDEAGDPVYGSGPHRLANKATWEWSDNAPLVIADYFAHPDGYGRGYDAVNWTNIAQEADIADQLVETYSGETIARWRLWASYPLASSERKTVLTDMLKACDGFCWQDAACLFNLKVGRFEEPTVVLTDDHLGPMTATLGPQAQQRVNALKVLYTEAAIGYREQESATIADPDAPDDPNADPQAFEAYYAPHHNQASRLGKLMFARLGDRWHITGSTNLYGLNLIGERFCRLESARLGVAGYFTVGALRLNLADNTIEVTLDEVKPEDWDFDPAIDEGVPPETPDNAPPPPPLAAPTGLALSAVQIVLGQVNGVAISAAWDDPGRPDLSWEVQYRPTAGGDWVPMQVDQDARTARSGPVDSGTAYDVRVRALTITGRASAWTTASITPTADAPAIAPPTDLAADGGVGEADVTFRMPTTATLAYARLYHATSSDFGTATQLGSDIVDALGAMVEINHPGLSSGTHYYWARAYDQSGGSSALVGPVTATVS